jgi:hypothetical protein
MRVSVGEIVHVGLFSPPPGNFEAVMITLHVSFTRRQEGRQLEVDAKVLTLQLIHQFVPQV